jgi:hypothetical protein
MCFDWLVGAAACLPAAAAAVNESLVNLVLSWRL